MDTAPNTSVTASLNYTLDNGIPPDYYFYTPDPSVKVNPPGTDAHEMRIHDGWPQVDQFSLLRAQAGGGAGDVHGLTSIVGIRTGSAEVRGRSPGQRVHSTSPSMR